MPTPNPYKLLIVTPIPVIRTPAGYRTLDLWVSDLRTQVNTTGPVTLLAPTATNLSGTPADMPDDVRVVLYDEVHGEAELQRLIQSVEVVAINTGGSAKESVMQSRCAAAARALDRCLIACVTSNRVKTTLLNSREKSLVRRLKARWVARSVEKTQRRLVGVSDGVMVIGRGVSTAMHFGHPNEYIETASWIHQHDILPVQEMESKLRAVNGSLRACIATRLEPMKGVHVAIEAMHLLSGRPNPPCHELNIYGAGPALGDLQSSVSRYGLEKTIRFGGTFAYPEPFLSEIQKSDVILLTNLNDEQPRLVFDAIARGVLPICPDSDPYRGLSLPPEILYRRGDAESLAGAMDRIRALQALPDLIMTRLMPILHSHTADAMHRNRAQWIERTLHPYRKGTCAAFDRRN